MILAGDIGGTNSRLALFEVEGGALREIARQVFPSRDSPSLDAIVATFCAGQGARVPYACFGVAGPVRDGRVQAVNLAWSVEGASLARQLGGAEVWLINDLEANAYGIAALSPADFSVLNAGQAGATGNQAVISAGTGLGEAGLIWDGRRHTPFASEGGHADFAPSDELQMELLRFLMREHGHVSVERVLSGPGLHNIYRFLRDTERAKEPEWLARELADNDPPAVISRTALDGRAEICGHALEVMVAIYGAEAGNVALGMMATGGVFLGGGIAPRILPRLQSQTFLDAFRAKGRLGDLVTSIPVRVILNDSAALLGAARCAALRADLL
jgi:glucokinase